MLNANFYFGETASFCIRKEMYKNALTVHFFFLFHIDIHGAVSMSFLVVYKLHITEIN